MSGSELEAKIFARSTRDFKTRAGYAGRGLGARGLGTPLQLAAPLEKSNLDHEALLEDEAPPGLLDDLGLNFRCVKPPHRFKGSHETPVSPDVVRNRIDRLCAATH